PGPRGGHLRRYPAQPSRPLEYRAPQHHGRAGAGGGAAHAAAGRDRPARRRGLPRDEGRARRRRHRDDAAPPDGALSWQLRAIDPRVFSLLRPRLREACRGQARCAHHASGPDESRRRDRYGRGRRHRSLGYPPTGRDGCSGAHGLPRSADAQSFQRRPGEMSARTLFRDARLLDPGSSMDQTGDLLVENGRIAALGGRLSAGSSDETIDCAGACLAPGLIDMRVELREPGAEHQESMQSGGRAAVAGGVTTMVALPNTNPVIDDMALIEFVARRSRDVGLARIRTYAAATKGLKGRELTEFGLLAAAGALAFTDGGQAISDAVVMRRALAYARTFDLLVMQHPEEPSLAAGGAMNEGEVATRLGLSGITPAAEVIMVERDLRLCEITGG